VIGVESMSQTEGVREDRGGGEQRVKAQDYGYDGPYYKVGEDEEVDYSDCGVR
jgi:hypothetical protein